MLGEGSIREGQEGAITVSEEQYLALPESRAQSGEDSAIRLDGAWAVMHVAAIEAELKSKNKAIKDIGAATLDVRGVSGIDTAGALLIRKYFPGAQLLLSPEQQKLFDFLPDVFKPQDKDLSEKGLRPFLVRTGKRTAHAFDFFYSLIAYTGEVAARLGGCIMHPSRFRVAAIVRHIDETGLRALPIIGLLGLLISMVVSYQAAIQLQKFGASIFAVDLTVISLLREMGVLITAIMFAGRSGSAFAAEIGVMKLREEVDALRTIGVDPIETLVIPRVLALLITLPLLTFFANILGLAGGALMAQTLLDIPLTQYIDRVQYTATPLMFFVGMIKAPVFAFLIAIICTYQGMNVSGSAESVGRLTTVAVVQSIFIVLLVDAMFSIIFAQMGI